MTNTFSLPSGIIINIDFIAFVSPDSDGVLRVVFATACWNGSNVAPLSLPLRGEDAKALLREMARLRINTAYTSKVMGAS